MLLRDLVLVFVGTGFGVILRDLGAPLLAGLRRRPELPAPANVIAGVVLPDPADPRWAPTRCCRLDGLTKQCHGKSVHAYRLGSVVVRGDCKDRYSSVYVGGARLRNCSVDGTLDPYYLAVATAYMDRHAQASIEGQRIPAPRLGPRK